MERGSKEIGRRLQGEKKKKGKEEERRLNQRKKIKEKKCNVFGFGLAFITIKLINVNSVNKNKLNIMHIVNK